MDRSKPLPEPKRPYIPQQAFVTIALPAHEDYGDMAHEVKTVLTDLFGEPRDNWDVTPSTERGGYLHGFANRAVLYDDVKDALARVAARYGAPAFFWSHGRLHTVRVNGDG